MATVLETRVTSNRNGTRKPRVRLAPRPTLCPPVRVDSDVAHSMAIVMAGLFRRLLPGRFASLIEAALLRRAGSSFRLAQAADDPEDRQLGTMWEGRSPSLVHWEVGPESPSSPENVVFAACGRHDGVSMRDARWRHGLETTRPITCVHCRLLLEAAQAGTAE
jgi:hypothetical protein